MDIELTRVNVVGHKWFHVFNMDDGSTQEVETDGKGYTELQENKPSIKGGVWSHSFQRYKFDTPDGDLAEDQYYEEEDFSVLKKGKDFLMIEKEDIVDDKISKEVIDSAVINESKANPL